MFCSVWRNHKKRCGPHDNHKNVCKKGKGRIRGVKDGGLELAMELKAVGVEGKTVVLETTREEVEGVPMVGNRREGRMC
jgi:hypothetical protein